MNKKGQVLGIGAFFVMLIIAVVGVALLTSSADSVGVMTNKQSGVNQSVSVVNGFVDGNNVNESVNFTIYSQSDWKVAECPLESVAVRNGAGTALVADTDYTLYSPQGVFSLLNTSKTIPDTSLNTTYVDYSYCADGYNTSSGARSMATLIIVFFALGIAFFVLEKSGITNLTSWFN